MLGCFGIFAIRRSFAIRVTFAIWSIDGLTSQFIARIFTIADSHRLHDRPAETFRRART